MDLLGGYGSDGSDDGSTADSKPLEQAKQLDTDTAPSASTATDGVARKKKIDYSRLPVSRPLVFNGYGKGDTSPTGDAEPPLRLAAELEALRPSAARSLLASLPAPKVTLGSEASQHGSVRIDLSEVSRPTRELPTTTMGVLKSESVPDTILEGNVELPQNVASHPMFSDGSNNAVALLEAGDGPTQEEIQEMRAVKSFKKINADDMQDQNWYDQYQVLGAPGLHTGKKVPAEMSMYENGKWAQTTHANPSRIQKRKHQINWLAHDAMDKEAELADRNATSRLTKSQTQMKYGW